MHVAADYAGLCITRPIELPLEHGRGAQVLVWRISRFVLVITSAVDVLRLLSMIQRVIQNAIDHNSIYTPPGKLISARRVG